MRSAAQNPLILIADDSEMNRAILVEMLDSEYDIIEAEGGEEAVAQLRLHGTDLSMVLLDIVMPKMDGFGVLEEMNRTRLIEEVPVIMITSETTPSRIERAYEMGVTDFIGRPFDALIVRKRVVNTILLYAKQKKLINLVTDQIYEKEQSSSLMIDILSNIVEFRNGESGLHVHHAPGCVCGTFPSTPKITASPGRRSPSSAPPPPSTTWARSPSTKRSSTSPGG